MKKGMKIVRFIGIVCWFLALFILINGHQEKKKAAEEASKPSNTANGATPQTGDSVSLLPWFVLMLASFAVAAVSGILIRRKRAK